MIENSKDFEEQVKVLINENNVNYYKPQFDGKDIQFDFYQIVKVEDKVINSPIFIKTLFVKGDVYQMNPYQINEYCNINNFLID